jgi:hypothetical protein
MAQARNAKGRFTKKSKSMGRKRNTRGRFSTRKNRNSRNNRK